MTSLVDLKLGRDLPYAVLLVGSELEEAAFLRLAFECSNRLSRLGIPDLEVASIGAVFELRGALPCAEETAFRRELEVDDLRNGKIAFDGRARGSTGVYEASEIVHRSGKGGAVGTVLEDTSGALNLVKAIDRGVGG